MQAVVIGQKWKATDQKPQHGACNQIDGLDRTSVKDTRTSPCHRERGEKQGIGEIDADQIGDLPVHTKQRNRGKPQQMREAPPAHCAKRQILRPDEEQQQAEDGLNVDRHQKQRVEIEGHCSGWSVCPDPYRGLRPGKNNSRAPPPAMRRYGFKDLSNVCSIVEFLGDPARAGGLVGPSPLY